MEDIARIVSESLARHGFDRPLDYRRLRWSRWFRCESHHSLLLVPSKPGVFALAEEIMDLGTRQNDDHVGMAAPSCPAERSSAGPVWDRSAGDRAVWDRVSDPVGPSEARRDLAGSSNARSPRRMLAVTQFFAADDMAFVLDRMLSNQSPMRARLVSGRYFVRFVIIEDEAQRRSICNALNQWIAGSGEKASAIGAHFAASLELTDTRVGRAPFPSVDIPTPPRLQGQANIDPATSPAAAPQLDSGAATNIHCPAPFPSGF
jgi:hypothetical protein